MIVLTIYGVLEVLEVLVALDNQWPILKFCLGFNVKDTSKGLYFDGHEREDIVKDRMERFIPELMEAEAKSVSVQYQDDGSIQVVRLDAQYIIVEKIHHSN